MADTIIHDLVQLDARVAEINQEISLLDAENESLSAQINENTKRRLPLRKEREGLSKIRDSARVAQRVASDEQAAAKARADAEALHKEAAALKDEQAALVAKAKADAAELQALLAKAKESQAKESQEG